MQRRLTFGNSTKICIHTSPSIIDSPGKRTGYRSRREPHRVPSSDSVDSPPTPNTTAWNSWTLPKVAWNLAHQKLEFLNRNFLLFFCLPCSTLAHVRISPLSSGKTRHHLISVTPLNAPSRTLIGSLLPPRILCSIDPEWESAYLPTNEEADVVPFFGARIVGILDFFIYLLRSVTLRFSRLSHITLRIFPFACVLCFARSAKHNGVSALFYTIFDVFIDIFFTKIVIHLFF